MLLIFFFVIMRLDLNDENIILSILEDFGLLVKENIVIFIFKKVELRLFVKFGICFLLICCCGFFFIFGKFVLVSMLVSFYRFKGR